MNWQRCHYPTNIPTELSTTQPFQVILYAAHSSQTESDVKLAATVRSLSGGQMSSSLNFQAYYCDPPFIERYHSSGLPYRYHHCYQGSLRSLKVPLSCASTWREQTFQDIQCASHRYVHTYICFGLLDAHCLVVVDGNNLLELLAGVVLGLLCVDVVEL